MSELPAAIRARVADLRRQGAYERAAELCLAHGAPLAAADLFAEVWRWGRAIAICRAEGALDAAYRHAVRSRDAAVVASVVDEMRALPAVARDGAETARTLGRPFDAARLAEAAGDLEAASRDYDAAGEIVLAARAAESAGRTRDAGRLWERRLAEAPDDDEAAFRLGAILASLGRWEAAASALQRSARAPSRRAASARLLVSCFASLGLDRAAETVLDELRRADPSLPLSVPEYLQETFGDARGLAGLGATTGADLLAGRYAVLRPLGSGGTGRVVLARDAFFEREVAIKILDVAGGAASRDALARFLAEARIAASLDHPNVVRVHELLPDGPFLVMELMAGGTLEDRLAAAAGPLDRGVARHVVLSVLDGLEALHRRGVVHRDLKPANVFFGATGDVKLGDFGVAHLADLGATLTGAMLGTLATMSPEQITGSAPPSAATDLYALGVILFRMLTGRLPFPGPDFVTQHLSSPAPRPSELDASLAPFDDLVLALLAKSPSDRPPGAAEVRARALAIEWHDPGAAARAVEEAGAPARPVTAAPSSRPPAPTMATRYVPVSALAGGATLARDTGLDRLVRLVPLDDALERRVRAWARADGPFLQAVYDVDAASRVAVLEHPSGVALASLPDGDARRAAATGAITRALAAASLDEDGAALDVVVGDGRAVARIA